MEKNILKELYIDELRDVHDAENQLVKALPKMAKVAESDELRSAFEEHLKQTKGHVQRRDQIFQALNESPKGKPKCKGIQGLVEEGQEMINELKGEALDAGLISAAQRVEHYEIAAYGTVRTYAGILGEEDAVALLEETLKEKEEDETDEKLTESAESVNVEAAQSEPDQEESEARPTKAKAARG
jgi:ferritin-like metal-binding protein YciE